MQALVVSRLLKYGGFAVVFLLLPVISLLTYSAMALLPLLLVVRVMKTAENATAYSINNTARHVLWLPTTRGDEVHGQAGDRDLLRPPRRRSGGGDDAGRRAPAALCRRASFFVVNVALVVGWLVRRGRRARPPR